MNAALYVRPFLFGSGPQLGLKASEEYQFVVVVVPIGGGYYGNAVKAVTALIVDDYDRSAPRGMGAYKVRCCIVQIKGCAQPASLTPRTSRLCPSRRLATMHPHCYPIASQPRRAARLRSPWTPSLTSTTIRA